MTQDQKRDGDRALEKKHRRPENKRVEKHMKNALRSSNFQAHLHDDELDECGFEDDEDGEYYANKYYNAEY